MQIISFKNTSLFKRGIWLSAAALVMFVTAPAAVDGSLWRNPTTHLVVLAALIASFIYFFWKTHIHRLADEVVDCGDHLTIKRGSTEENISFSKISAAEVATAGGITRITIRLRELTGFGGQIEFLPQASLWSNLPGIERVAAALTERAKQAKNTHVEISRWNEEGDLRGKLTGGV
jgi:hypothetical protein